MNYFSICFNIEWKSDLFIDLECPSISTFKAPAILPTKFVTSWFAFAEYKSDVITKNTSPAPIVSSTFSEIKAGVCNIFDFK